MKKSFLILATMLLAMVATAQNVTVVYSGDTAMVTVDPSITQYLTVTQNGAHVSIAQGDSLATEITYNLSGSSTDGEFYMSGSYKATLELNGLSLTNLTPVYSGAAVHIQNGKRIKVKVVTGTTNSLTDAASGSQKGCLYIKGHAEFAQQGTLNVVGNVKHAIKAGEYITLKNATLNITSAVGDGISCNEYFLMQSGTVSISGTGDDGIQCDLDGTESTGETDDHEDEDSGNIYISGGTININCAAIAAKGIKSAGDMNISGGTLNLTATGSGGKGMKCDSVLTITDGFITVATSGGLYYNNGTTENTNYTGNTDNVSSDYYSSPKGIKAGVKVATGTTTVYGRTVTTYDYYGGMVINGGNIRVTTSGRNAEGIECKNTLEINGGEIYVNSYDDAINSGNNMTINGGYIYARSTNNDGLDANGNLYINGGLVLAIGASSPELAIDANSEEQKKVYIYGGVVIAVGGIESGSVISQPYIQRSSVSSNTWYTITCGDSAVSFLTPTVSSGGGGHGPGGSSNRLVISTPNTPTLANGNNASDGTSHFDGKCYVRVDGGNVGIDEVEAMEPTSDNRTYTIDGRYLGTEVPATFRGIYLQNGKKHLKMGQ